LIRVRPDGVLRGLRTLGLAHARLSLRATKSPTAICRTGLFIREFELKTSSLRCLTAALNPEKIGAPGRIRTADTLVRSQVLYPAELRAQARSLSSARPFRELYWNPRRSEIIERPISRRSAAFPHAFTVPLAPQYTISTPVIRHSSESARGRPRAGRHFPHGESTQVPDPKPG
jgi:hypothetical protein